jgi:hypothetical protein
MTEEEFKARVKLAYDQLEAASGAVNTLFWDCHKAGNIDQRNRASELCDALDKPLATLYYACEIEEPEENAA